MKAELRIGNLIGQGEVMEIKENVVRVKYTADKERTSLIRYEDIQPIPLSEEVLLKCCKSYEFFHDGVIIYKFGAFNAYKQNRIWLADSLGGFGKEYKHINYLHQLQNLYYALTGEELEVSDF